MEQGMTILLQLALLGLAGWGAVSPRTQWRYLQAWAYKHPEKNEPSDLGFAVQQIASAILFAFVLVNVCLS